MVFTAANLVIHILHDSTELHSTLQQLYRHLLNLSVRWEKPDIFPSPSLWLLAVFKSKGKDWYSLSCEQSTQAYETARMTSTMCLMKDPQTDIVHKAQSCVVRSRKDWSPALHTAMNTDLRQMFHHCGTSLTEQVSYFVMVHVPMWGSVCHCLLLLIIFTPSLWDKLISHLS